MKQTKDPCEGCVDYIALGSGKVCDYMLRNGHKRPCPPAAACTVKSTKPRDQADKRVRRPYTWDVSLGTRLHKEGKNDRQIAEAVGARPEAVRAWRRRVGLPANRPAP